MNITKLTDGLKSSFIYQERRTVFPVSRPVLSHSQASHHIHDHQDHLVGAQESSVPIYGFSDGDGRVRQRWPSQRPAYSGNGVEVDGWQRATRSVSRVGSVTATEQVCVTIMISCLNHS